MTVGDDDDDGPGNTKPLYSFNDIFGIGAQSIGVRWLTQEQPQLFRPQRDANHHSYDRLYHTGTSLPPRHQLSRASSGPGHVLREAALAAPPAFLYQGPDSSIILQEINANVTTFPAARYQQVLLNFTSQVNDPTVSKGYYSESPAVVQDPTSGYMVPKGIILAKDYVKGWRHSFSATFLVWDVEQKQLNPLDPTNTNSSDMNPVWSPDGTLVVMYSSLRSPGVSLTGFSSTGLCSRQQRTP